MSNEGFKVQASVKDADGDMVNVRADSNEELESTLLNFPTAAYAQFKANVRGGASLGGIVQPSQQAAQPAQQAPQQAQGGGGWSNPPQQQFAPQQPPAQNGGGPHPEGRQCQMCGTTLQHKVVTRKSDNKQFKFWACPNQRNRDDGHTSEFA